MKIALASDHAGFELKEALKSTLLLKHEIIDFGADSENSMDYPDSGFPACEAVKDGKCDIAILVCGTGIGMSIVANKVKTVRAALCQTTDFAELTRKHNDANVLVLSGRFCAYHYAMDIVTTFINTEFEGGRHQRRIDKILEYENKNWGNYEKH